MATQNLTRSYRDANEAGLSGAEAIEVENVGKPDQIVSAGAEEQLALGAFKDHQLQCMALLSDQDVTAQFLGLRYAVNQTAAGEPGTIDVLGDLEQEIYIGDIVRLEDMPDAGDNGMYFVDDIAELAGTTTITLGDGQEIPTAVGGAIGTVARVACVQKMTYEYTMATAVAITGVITVTGNVTDVFEAGGWLIVRESGGNDGLWEIHSVDYVAPTTTIVVNDRQGTQTLPAGTTGVIASVRPFIELAANVSFLWSRESGLYNPFHQNTNDPTGGVAIPRVYDVDRGDVAFCMVNNPGTVNANVDIRIGTNAVIF